MRGFEKSALTSAAIQRVLGRVELDREQRVLVRGCDGGMTVVPTTAEVKDSWSSAARVTSS